MYDKHFIEYLGFLIDSCKELCINIVFISNLFERQGYDKRGNLSNGDETFALPEEINTAANYKLKIRRVKCVTLIDVTGFKSFFEPVHTLSRSAVGKTFRNHIALRLFL